MKADFPTLLISRVQPIKIISTTERHALIWLGPKCCFVTSRQQVPRGFGFLWMGDPRRGQVVVEATRQRAAKLGLFTLQGSGQRGSLLNSAIKADHVLRPSSSRGGKLRSVSGDRSRFFLPVLRGLLARMASVSDYFALFNGFQCPMK